MKAIQLSVTARQFAYVTNNAPVEHMHWALRDGSFLRLHYDKGRQKYELQQKVSPGEQMWVNLAQLVRERVPDRKGNLLPVDVKLVTYDVQDLTPGGGSLSVSNLALDATYGGSAGPPPPCPECCAYQDIAFDPSSVFLPVDGTEPVVIDGVSSCTNEVVDISGDFNSWASQNRTIAQLSARQVQGLTPGVTTGFANGDVPTPGACGCPGQQVEPVVPVTVTQCPSSISLSSTTPIPLEQGFPTYKTGIGIGASMMVSGPSSNSYNGSQISESLSINGVMQNTCPAKYFSECNGSSTFTVGTGGEDYGVIFQPANNIFYDDHSLELVS